MLLVVRICPKGGGSHHGKIRNLPKQKSHLHETFFKINTEMTCWVILKQHWPIKKWKHIFQPQIQVEKDGIYTSETGRNEDLDIHHLVVDFRWIKLWRPLVSNYVNKPYGWTRNVPTLVEMHGIQRHWQKKTIQDVVNIIFRPLPKNNFPPLSINILLMITFLADYYTPEN